MDLSPGPAARRKPSLGRVPTAGYRRVAGSPNQNRTCPMAQDELQCQQAYGLSRDTFNHEKIMGM